VNTNGDIKMRVLSVATKTVLAIKEHARNYDSSSKMAKKAFRIHAYSIVDICGLLQAI
jgi:hypothetical protein